MTTFFRYAIAIVLIVSSVSSLPFIAESNKHANGPQELDLRIFKRAAIQSAECDEARRVGNDAMNKMLIIFDRNVTEVPSLIWFKTNYCDKFVGWHKKLFEYRKCLKPFAQTVFSFVMGDIKAMYNEYCINEKEMELAFEHLKCMDNDTKPEIMRISDMIHKSISYMSTLRNVYDILPASCCGTHLILDEMNQTLTKLCPSKSRPDTPEFASHFFKAILSDIEIWCENYQTIESCNQQQQDMMSDLRREMRNTTPVYESFMISWWNVLLRLDEMHIDAIVTRKDKAQLEELID